ncbi:Hpt domain-containing protein [Roseomonas sp. OT10]|uniref:Hpt domain-containing protein n=1 Tax=Roseomonas cutis TaxID=2897332 RepID=UPI001E5C409B|nr:Hpt domain-containing protein [Roseomonas sp. OT10]UFN50201.1 Hpt domain-containing protein [Roseomonas sp. OT10]
MKVIDPEVAGALASELPPEVFATIVQTFEADVARLLQELVAASRTGDTVAWHRGAHSLAGAAGGVGATQLEALAREAMRPDHLPSATVALRLGEAAKAALEELGQLAAAG